MDGHEQRSRSAKAVSLFVLIFSVFVCIETKFVSDTLKVKIVDKRRVVNSVFANLKTIFSFG
jgi:hypothetical protein